MTDRTDSAGLTDADRSAADAERARRLHERTGEIELLISGALVFGLIRLPALVGGAFDSIAPGLSEDQFALAYMVSLYLRLTLLTLICAFMLHLVTRAYWVGLVGLDSVFPDGIEWSQIKYGRVAKEVYRERVSTLSAAARRADDFGSSIFSFAFWISVIFVWSIVLFVVSGGLYLLVRAVAGPIVGPVHVLVGIALVVGLPSMGVALDKGLEGRIDPEGRVARGLARVIAFGYWVSAGPIFYPIQFVLFSRVPKKYIWPLFVSVLGVLVVVFMAVETTTRTGAMVSGSDIYPTRPGPRTVGDNYFAPTRDPNSTLPFIQSDVVEGPYVRLTVPLMTLRLESRVGSLCEDLDREGDVGFRAGVAASEPADADYETAVLDCMGQIWSVSLDDRPVPIEWDLRWSGTRGPSGLAAFIPTEGLEPGPHVLEIREAARARTEEELAELEAAGEDPPGPSIHYIRFRR